MENGNINRTPKTTDSLGYLIVRVSTALGAIPLENATVHIRGGSPADSGVIYSLLSDRDGLTPRVSLPTPPKERSDSPGSPTPFSAYNVEVIKEGYIPVSFQNIPVYPDIVSVQPAVLIPKSERAIYEQIYNESTAPRL